MNQEAIAIIDEILGKDPATPASRLPQPIKPSRPITMEETLRFIEDGQKNCSQPGWAKDSLRILHSVEGPAIQESDWNMLHDDIDPLK